MNRFLVVAALIATVSGCGKFEARVSPARVFNFDYVTMSSAQLRPESDKVDTDCMSKGQYDACLFEKNPVASARAPISGIVSAGNYDTVQNFGVKLTGLTSGSTRLENDTFVITSLKGEVVSPLAKSDLKSKAQTETASRFSSVTAYYWLNRATEYLSLRTGYFPASGRKIRVVVDDVIGGWSSGANSIHLKGDGSNPMAWSPELAVHYLGLANLHFASGGNTDTPSAATHRLCDGKPAGCCSAAVGCSRAIASGVGDYFVGLIFPDQPVIGETWANAIDGMQACSQTRNLNQSAKRTAQAAFDACTSATRPGDAATLGHIYASIWWEVRKAAAAQNPKGQVEIDALFMNHLMDLDGADTFRTAFQKIRILDNSVFAGRHVSLFESEFAARGL